MRWLIFISFLVFQADSARVDSTSVLSRNMETKMHQMVMEDNLDSIKIELKKLKFKLDSLNNEKSISRER